MKRVVITGVGLITPIGIGKEDFWQSNKLGKSGTCYLPQYDKFGFKETGNKDEDEIELALLL